MTNTKFRASYSVLNTWKSGNWQRAIEMYFKLADFATPQMVAGREQHEVWEKYINENKCLPVEFNNTKLTNPLTEIKKVVQLSDWLELVGKIDCYDTPTIHEFKTGKQSSESYASSPQIGVYGVLLTVSGLFVDRAVIHHYDQYTKQYDASFVWITPEVLKDSMNWIVTLSGEMHNYFLENELYEKYGHNFN